MHWGEEEEAEEEVEDCGRREEKEDRYTAKVSKRKTGAQR